MSNPKVLVISDDGVPTGYGRIAMETNLRLHRRGYLITALSVAYDGVMPPTLEGRALSYHVGGAQGRDFIPLLMGMVGAIQPDIIHVVQDAPWAELVYNSPVDWSRYALVITTPVDGVPIDPDWIDLFKRADGMLTISEYGVKAHADHGVRSALCRPGVDMNAFYRYTDAERLELRKQAGIEPDAFVLMSAAQNQGRKAIPSMLQGFFQFAKDKPSARYIMDMERTSPAGWNFRKVCYQWGWDYGKLIFRDDLIRRGINTLPMRFNLADAHAVLAFREGYGMPLAEAMACGAVSIAQDYCSGTEIVSGGKGMLIRSVEGADTIGTWGGAVDKVPDVLDFVDALEFLYDFPGERRAMAERGMAWARQQTWDSAADAVSRVYDAVLARRSLNPTESQNNPQKPTESAPSSQPPAPQKPLGVDGRGNIVAEVPIASGDSIDMTQAQYESLARQNLAGIEVKVNPKLKEDEWYMMQPPDPVPVVVGRGGIAVPIPEEYRDAAKMLMSRSRVEGVARATDEIEPEYMEQARAARIVAEDGTLTPFKEEDLPELAQVLRASARAMQPGTRIAPSTPRMEDNLPPHWHGNLTTHPPQYVTGDVGDEGAVFGHVEPPPAQDEPRVLGQWYPPKPATTGGDGND